MVGRVHSFESMGLVDGPGIRCVVFMQGCQMRCRYCHNPDTWAGDGQATLYTPQTLYEKILRFKGYFGKTGGVTFSGGEPLLQADFLCEVLPLLRDARIHCCVDTAGFYDLSQEQAVRRVAALSDLVLLDIKHYDPEAYQSLTGQPIDCFRRFLSIVQEESTPLWLRHVVVPGLTSSDEHILALRTFINTLKNVQKVELLGYHTLGVHKYEAMGLPYSLAGTPSCSPKALEHLNQLIDGGA